MPPDYEALQAEAEVQLIEFIFGELQMGATWVETAKIAKDSGHMHHYAQAKDYVSHCTSWIPFDTTSFAARRSDSLIPWALRGGLSPGCSYRQSFLSV
jgi:hypothetical protein